MSHFDTLDHYRSWWTHRILTLLLWTLERRWSCNLNRLYQAQFTYHVCDHYIPTCITDTNAFCLIAKAHAIEGWILADEDVKTLAGTTKPKKDVQIVVSGNPEDEILA